MDFRHSRVVFQRQSGLGAWATKPPTQNPQVNPQNPPRRRLPNLLRSLRSLRRMGPGALHCWNLFDSRLSFRHIIRIAVPHHKISSPLNFLFPRREDVIHESPIHAFKNFVYCDPVFGCVFNIDLHTNDLPGHLQRRCDKPSLWRRWQFKCDIKE